jgi:hypothetical protein
MLRRPLSNPTRALAIATAGLTAALALTGPVGTRSAAAATPRCPDHPRHLLAASYRTKAYYVGSASEHTVYACLDGGRPRELGITSTPRERVEDVRLAGRYAAVVNGAFGPGYGFDRVSLVNLRTGRSGTLTDRPTGGYTEDLALTANGTIVVLEVILASPELAPTPRDPRQIRVRTRLGAETVLATGPMDPGSLALTQDERRVYWTAAGAPAISALP